MDYQQLFFELLELVHTQRDLQRQYNIAMPGHETNFLMQQIRKKAEQIDEFMIRIQQPKNLHQCKK